jgi:hypothetical protein
MARRACAARIAFRHRAAPLPSPDAKPVSLMIARGKRLTDCEIVTPGGCRVRLKAIFPLAWVPRPR